MRRRLHPISLQLHGTEAQAFLRYFHNAFNISRGLPNFLATRNLRVPQQLRSQNFFDAFVSLSCLFVYIFGIGANGCCSNISTLHICNVVLRLAPSIPKQRWEPRNLGLRESRPVGRWGRFSFEKI
ncbi:hypothetical protein EJ08DRAFT_300321 [Tothia fuscella]|uniref:Uncharacterized protein n=1 Tax=Tothia fuscella TaxID=1048955 RepID=A0A9P4TX94_9PEZI|nr:hypothetical protein EJ08DRAFT_300321 [Tothia fuscella]